MTGMNFPGFEDSVNKTASTETDAGGRLFDPTALANSIIDNQKKVTATAGSVGELGAIIGQDAETKVRQAVQAKQHFEVGVDSLLKQIEDSNSILVDASDKARKARYVPEAVSMVMSIFGNNDYDTDYQHKRIEESMRALDLSNRRVNAIGTIADVKQQLATQAIQGQKTVLDAVKTQAEATEAATRSLLQLQNAKDIQDVRLLERLTDAQILQAMNSPDFASKVAPGIGKGMIEKVAKEREQLNLALTQTRMTLAHLKKTYPLAEESQGLDVALKRANVPMEQQRALNAQVTMALDNLPSGQRKALADEAEANGGYAQLQLGDGTAIQVSNSQIQAATTKRTTQAIEDASKNAKLVEAKLNVDSFIIGSGDMIDRLTTTHIGQASPDEIKGIANQTQSIIRAAQSGDPAAIMASDKVVDKINAKIKELDDKYKKEFPLQAPAAKQYIYSGTVQDVTAASTNLSDRFKIGANLIPAGSLFYDAGESLKGFSKYYSSQNSIFPGGMKDKDGKATGSMSLEDMIKSPPKEMVAFETWLSKPSDNPNAVYDMGQGKGPTRLTNEQFITTSVRSRLRLDIVSAAVKDLAQTKPDGGADPTFVTALVNGKLRSEYQANIKNLFADLATADTIQGTKSLETLIGKLNEKNFQNSILTYYQGSMNSVDAASISKRFMNNDPIAVVGTIKSDLDTAVRTAQQQKAQAARTASDLVGTPMISPTGLMGSPEDYAASARIGGSTLVQPRSNPLLIMQDKMIQSIMGGFDK